MSATKSGCFVASYRSEIECYSEVVGAEGERAFNRCLTEILTHQITKENIIVTTDESITRDEKACELLKSEFTVYLKVSTVVQLERISEGDYRPLLPVDNFAALLDKNDKQTFLEAAHTFDQKARR